MNDPYPLTQCQPLTLEKFKTLNPEDYLMEPKIDGWRLQIEVNDGQVRAWTRTRHDASGKLIVPEKLLAEIKVPGGFRLDGEVVYLNEKGKPDYNFTARTMGSGVGVCRDKQFDQQRYLTFFAFDLLRQGEKDLRKVPYGLRRELLEALLKDVGAFVQVIPVDFPTIEQHYKFTDQYGEGSVLKQITYPYAGRRHKSWLKWKAEETIEVKIIGYKEGQGKFANMIGAITFQSPDGTIGNCSGMDDATREFITSHRGVLLNRTFEVKHYGRLVDGYRHPQFVRFRADK